MILWTPLREQVSDEEGFLREQRNWLPLSDSAWICSVNAHAWILYLRLAEKAESSAFVSTDRKVRIPT